MANVLTLKSLLHRNPILSASSKKEIVKKWEAADSVCKNGLMKILIRTEEKLKLSLVKSFKLKPAKEFLSAWKEFEIKLRKEISSEVEIAEAQAADAALTSELNAK